MILNLNWHAATVYRKYINVIIFIDRISRDKTMINKLMYIPNDVTQNYPFCRLQLVVETFGHSI